MERMEKQTAVEWLVEQLDNTTIFSKYVFLEIIEQAKAMEKENIKIAFNYGLCDLGMEADEYFDNTFKSE